MKVTVACVYLWLCVVAIGSLVGCKNSSYGSDDGSGLPTPPELIPLRFTFLTTDGGEGCVQYSNISIPALQMAMEDINANSSVLPRFQLEYNLERLPKCSTETALDAFFRDVFSRNSIISFLGSACAQATRPIAELVHRWNISEILSSPLLIETNEGGPPTPNLLQMYPEESLLVPALVSFMTQAGWKRLFILSGPEPMFNTMFSILSTQLQKQNITVGHKVITVAMNTLNHAPDFIGEMENYRIIFLNMNPRLARQILCFASTNGYVYPMYTWMLYGWYGTGWWRVCPGMSASDRHCTTDELLRVLERAISFRVYPTTSNRSAVSDAGISNEQFKRRYYQHVKQTNPDRANVTYSYLAPLTYDAVWALARALHRVNTKTSILTHSIELEGIPCADMCAMNNSINLGDFDYSNSYLGCLIKQELRNSNFVGVSGAVNFTENGARYIKDVALLQYRRSDTLTGVSNTLFAEYNIPSLQLMYVSGEDNSTVFPYGISPDGTPRNITVTFKLGLTITYYTIATLGIVFTFVCLVFNVKYRNTRVVKLTSPTINYFLIIGALMMFLSIYIRVLPHTGQKVNEYRCNIQNWLNIIAYCLGYGTILTKMGRVYKIFHNPSTRKKQMGVKDWHMVAVVALIAGIGVLLLTIKVAVPQLRPNLALRPSEEDDSGKDEFGVTINYHAWQCYGGVAKAPYYYLLFMFCYLALLQLIGLVLAIRTRKVKITILNDSKYIMAIIYVSSLVIVIMALVTFVSGTRINLNEAFFSAGLLFSTLIFLSLTFIPKMVSYHRDPSGESVMKCVTGTHCVELHHSGAMTVKRTEQERINRLETRVNELEEELTAYKSLRAEQVFVNSQEEEVVITPRTACSRLSESCYLHSSPYRTNIPHFNRQCSAESLSNSAFALTTTTTQTVCLRRSLMVESNSTGNMSNTSANNTVAPSSHITNETGHIIASSNRTSGVIEGILSLTDDHMEHTTATPDRHHQQMDSEVEKPTHHETAETENTHTPVHTDTPTISEP